MVIRAAILAVAVTALLAIAVGAALAGPRAAGPAPHDAMHASEQMRAMHAGMPEELQAECDAMHAQMGSMHQGAAAPHLDMESMHPGATT